MYQHQFDRAIGEPPPSTVDVEAIIARGRRAVWVHRVANPWTATAAAVTAVAAGATFLFLPGNSGSGLSGGYVAPASSPSGEPSPRPPSTVPATPLTSVIAPGQTMVCAPPPPAPPPEDPEAAARRLTDVLTRAVQAQLAPGTQLATNAEHYPKGVSRGPLEFYYDAPHSSSNGCTNGGSGFEAAATTLLAGKKGNVYALIGQNNGTTSVQNWCAAYAPDVISDVAGTCQRQPDGPNGEIVFYITIGPKSGDYGPTVNEVDVLRPDGTEIGLYSENVGDTAKNKERPETPRPPLTHQQLAAIALDPGLTLYPH